MFDDGNWLLTVLGVLASIALVICIGSIVETAKHPERCFSYREFDGHQYVMFHDGYRGGIAHSPKCPCFEDNEKFGKLKTEEIQR